MMIEAKNILFDLDKTMLNTGLFIRTFLAQVAQKWGASQDAVTMIHSQYLSALATSTAFDPAAYLLSFQGSLGGEMSEWESLLFNETVIRDSVFEDVKPVLTQLRQAGFQLGVFSEGIETWQQRKLALTGLTTFFKPELIFITRHKTSPDFYQALPDHSVIVDDKVTVVEKLRTVTQIPIIWLNRQHQPQTLSGPSITSLAELPALLQFTP